MIKTLHGRLTAIVVALFALSSVLALLLTSSTTRAYAEEERQRLNASLAADLASYLKQEKLIPVTDENMEEGMEEIKRLMTVNPSIDVYLLDGKGRIVSSSTALNDLDREAVALEPIDRYLQPSPRLPLKGDDPRGGDPQVFSASRFRGGIFYVVLGRTEGTFVDALAGSYALRAAAAMFGGVALFSIFSGGYIFWALTMRMRKSVGSRPNSREPGLARLRTDATRSTVSTTPSTRWRCGFDRSSRRCSKQTMSGETWWPTSPTTSEPRSRAFGAI